MRHWVATHHPPREADSTSPHPHPLFESINLTDSIITRYVAPIGGRLGAFRGAEEASTTSLSSLAGGAGGGGTKTTTSIVAVLRRRPSIAIAMLAILLQSASSTWSGTSSHASAPSSRRCPARWLTAMLEGHVNSAETIHKVMRENKERNLDEETVSRSFLNDVRKHLPYLQLI